MHQDNDQNGYDFHFQQTVSSTITYQRVLGRRAYQTSLPASQAKLLLAALYLISELNFAQKRERKICSPFYKLLQRTRASVVQKDKKFTSLGARGLGQILHRSRQLAAVLVVECWLDLRKEALSQFRFASALSCGGWGKLFNAGINPTKSVSTPVKISVYSRMHSLE